ncbi:stalk domain-containing protein [Paenibacillus montanisoli]|uniref:Copper amine oxidase-like N-terminal domain-containing protein n=1 Tax=Paenibacillus montanisoli TaxID=2081970 RepID=A0A328TZF6_9BACL|nr:hypothetical protein DL346_10835 [Paenibacillus montanisoli]
MKPTGTNALVDGKSVPVNGEMKLINGHTMVGVRFIATLSNKTVNWKAPINWLRSRINKKNAAGDITPAAFPDSIDTIVRLHPVSQLGNLGCFLCAADFWLQ